MKLKNKSHLPPIWGGVGGVWDALVGNTNKYGKTLSDKTKQEISPSPHLGG